MGSPTLGATRWARAAALGVATLALAIGAHVSAGGALPSPTVLVFLALPLAMAAVIVTGRRCGPTLLLGSMTVAQFMLHHTLMVATSHAGAMPGRMSGVPASSIGGHVHSIGEHVTNGAFAQAAAQAATQATTAATAQTDGWSLLMTATHVVATVVAALLLARSEQALWQLVSRLIPSLPSLPSLVGWQPLQTPRPVSLPALVLPEMSGGLGLRGPPAQLMATG